MNKKSVESFGFYWFNKSWDEFKKMCFSICDDEWLSKHIWEKLEARLKSENRISAGYNWYFGLDDELRTKVLNYIGNIYGVN